LDILALKEQTQTYKQTIERKKKARIITRTKNKKQNNNNQL